MQIKKEKIMGQHNELSCCSLIFLVLVCHGFYGCVAVEAIRGRRSFHIDSNDDVDPWSQKSTTEVARVGLTASGCYEGWNSCGNTGYGSHTGDGSGYHSGRNGGGHGVGIGGNDGGYGNGGAGAGGGRGGGSTGIGQGGGFGSVGGNSGGNIGGWIGGGGRGWDGVNRPGPGWGSGSRPGYVSGGRGDMGGNGQYGGNGLHVR